MSVSIPDFKRKLEEQHSFPTVYMFKFIVPSDKENEVIATLPEGDITTKPSREGKYVSVTARLMMVTSADVINIYEEMHGIEGLIAL